MGELYRPPYSEQYPYEPYEFANMDEITRYLEQAKSLSFDFLYTRVKEFVSEYNEQDDSRLTLIASDIMFSYFQDKFATTHYTSIVGDNDSGKSSLGVSFEALAYRPVYMTDPSAELTFIAVLELLRQDNALSSLMRQTRLINPRK